MCLCGDQRSALGISLYCCLSYLMQGLSVSLEFISFLESLATKPWGSSCLLLSELGSQVCTATPGFLGGCWGFEPYKHFTHWVVSLAPSFLSHSPQGVVCVHMHACVCTGKQPRALHMLVKLSGTWVYHHPYFSPRPVLGWVFHQEERVW